MIIRKHNVWKITTGQQKGVPTQPRFQADTYVTEANQGVNYSPVFGFATAQSVLDHNMQKFESCWVSCFRPLSLVTYSNCSQIVSHTL